MIQILYHMVIFSKTVVTVKKINRMLVKMLKKTSNEYAMKIMQCSSVSMLQNFWSKPGVKTKLTQC